MRRKKNNYLNALAIYNSQCHQLNFLLLFLMVQGLHNYLRYYHHFFDGQQISY